MIIERYKEPVFEFSKSYNKEIQVGEEELINIYPEIGKCIIDKNTQHKFINNKTNRGLPIYGLSEEKLKLYEEVNI